MSNRWPRNDSAIAASSSATASASATVMRNDMTEPGRTPKINAGQSGPPSVDDSAPAAMPPSSTRRTTDAEHGPHHGVAPTPRVRRPRQPRQERVLQPVPRPVEVVADLVEVERVAGDRVVHGAVVLAERELRLVGQLAAQQRGGRPVGSGVDEPAVPGVGLVQVDQGQHGAEGGADQRQQRRSSATAATAGVSFTG